MVVKDQEMMVKIKGLKITAFACIFVCVCVLFGPSVKHREVSSKASNLSQVFSFYQSVLQRWLYEWSWHSIISLSNLIKTSNVYPIKNFNLKYFRLSCSSNSEHNEYLFLFNKYSSSNPGVSNSFQIGGQS